MSKSLKLEDIKQIATERNGICLSKFYINNHSHLLFKCEKGHEWNTSAKMIKRGTWCPHCYDSNQRKTDKRKPEKIDEVHSKAQEHGGKCLSTEYINNRSYLRFRCKNDHEWETNWKCINRNAWCPICSLLRKIDPNNLYQQKLDDIVLKRNGSRLDKYLGARHKIRFKCQFNHEWEATPNNIKNGSWCNECSSGFYERVCKQYFEQLFGHSFIKIKPLWLKSKTGGRLELDGYCADLKLSFEHNGVQHYSRTSYFDSDEKSFLKRQNNDNEKLLLCNKSGVKLITIPQLNTFVKIDDLKTFIKLKCLELNIEIPKNYDDINVDLSGAYSNFNWNKLKELQDIAKSKNGICVSEEYVSCVTKMKWKCNACNHSWETTSNSIMNGHWCPSCANKIPITIDEICELAHKLNGRCLSKTYINNSTKMQWQCNICDHKWNSTYNSIQSGRWCPPCSVVRRSKKKTLTLDVYKAVAKLKGGKCLSTEYKGCYGKLLWQCNLGHEWEARADAIKNTSRWCPVCAKYKKIKNGR